MKEKSLKLSIKRRKSSQGYVMLGENHSKTELSPVIFKESSYKFSSNENPIKILNIKITKKKPSEV